MNNDIRKVRKSIENRKKSRGLPVKSDRSHQIYPYSLPQEEEKHGYFPVLTEGGMKQKPKSSEFNMTGFILKGVLSLMLFLSTALLMKTDSELLSSPREWTSYAMSEEFPFARVNQWYQSTFGAPLAFQPEFTNDNQQPLALPASGQVIESFDTHGSGIMIAPDKQTTVSALKDGIVLFAGNNQKTGKTIVVQHADNSVTTYGFLSSIDVHVYQSVSANEEMGVFEPTEETGGFYFAIEKDNQPIDPVQVIKVDEQP